jgi:hypothetical protein
MPNRFSVSRANMTLLANVFILFEVIHLLFDVLRCLMRTLLYQAPGIRPSESGTSEPVTAGTSLLGISLVSDVWRSREILSCQAVTILRRECGVYPKGGVSIRCKGITVRSTPSRSTAKGLPPGV